MANFGETNLPITARMITLPDQLRARMLPPSVPLQLDLPPTFNSLSLDTRTPHLITPTFDAKTGKWNTTVAIHSYTSDDDQHYPGGVVFIWKDGNEFKHLSSVIIPTPQDDVFQAYRTYARNQINSQLIGEQIPEDEIETKSIEAAGIFVGTILNSLGPVSIDGRVLSIANASTTLTDQGLVVYNQLINKADHNTWLGNGALRHRTIQENDRLTIELLCGMIDKTLLVYCVDINSPSSNDLFTLLSDKAREGNLNATTIHDYVHPYIKTIPFDAIPDLNLGI